MNWAFVGKVWGARISALKTQWKLRQKNGKFLLLFLKCHSGSGNRNIITIAARSRKAIQEPGSDGAHVLVPKLRRQRQAGFFEFKASLVKTG